MNSSGLYFFKGVALVEDLIREYRKSIGVLRRAKVAPLARGSMISDAEWAIKIMETGRIPGAKWTVARWPKSKREVLCDPLRMACYVRNREPVNAAPEWMVVMLENMMKTLTEREKRAYELVRGRMFSFTQAGELMGCTKGSVQNFVKRAEKKIALVVQKQVIDRDALFG